MKFDMEVAWDLDKVYRIYNPQLCLCEPTFKRTNSRAKVSLKNGETVLTTNVQNHVLSLLTSAQYFSAFLISRQYFSLITDRPISPVNDISFMLDLNWLSYHWLPFCV